MLTSHASMSSPILSYLILSYLILSYPILAPLQLMVGINRGVKYIVTAAWLLESVNKKKVSLHYFYDVNAAQLLLHNCSTAQHNTLQYSTVQYNTLQYNSVQYRIEPHPIQSNPIIFCSYKFLLYVLQAIPITVKSRYIVKDAFTEKKWKFSLSETLSKDRSIAHGESRYFY